MVASGGLPLTTMVRPIARFSSSQARNHFETLPFHINQATYEHSLDSEWDNEHSRMTLFSSEVSS